MTAPNAAATRGLVARLAALEDRVAIDPAGTAQEALACMAEIDLGGAVTHRLRIRRILAMSYAHTNEFDRALAVCEEAVSLPGTEDDPVELARVRLASMQPLAIAGDIDQAIAAGEAALAMLESSGQPNLSGRAALNLGAIHAMIGHPDDALPYFDLARVHLAGVTLLMGQVESNRGTALAALDRFRESEEAFQRAIDLLDDREHSWAIAIAEGNLADLAARQGDPGRSLEAFESSRRRLEQDEAWGDLGRINAEEAALLAVMGMTQAAAERFAGAIAMLEEHGAPADLAAAHVAFAQALTDRGLANDAGEHLALAADLIEPDQNHDLSLRLAALRVRLALARNDPDAAAVALRIGLAATGDLPVQRVRWTILQAACERMRGNATLARTLLEAVRRTATPLVPLLAEIDSELADLAREEGDRRAELAHARSAVAAIERVRGTIHGDRLRQAWHHGGLGIAGRLYLALLADPDPDSQREAFAIAERMRNRSLLDAMGTAGLAAPVADSPQEQRLIDELDEHRRWLNWMYSALADGQEPDPVRLAELEERERAARTLEDRLATMRPGPGLQTPISFEEARERFLTGDTVLLSYLAVGDTLTVQAITRDRAWGVVDLVPLGRIRDLVGDLQFQIGRALVHGSAVGSSARQARLQRDADAVLEALYDAVIAPVSTILAGSSRLAIAPSGDLHSVPFAALKSDAGYLGETVEIVVAPGVSVAATMPLPPSGWESVQARPLVIGVPDASAPDLGTEARMIAERFPQVTAMFVQAATRAAVLAALPRSNLVHSATHGRFDPAHPGASGLRVADGWLTLDDLAHVRLDRPLMLLTGCETGRVQVGDGDDLEGLMAALIAAGASGLVASLWKTHDEAATALVSAFYDAIEPGLAPATALHRAQQAVRATWPHPAWWAPFVAVHGGLEG